MHLINMQFEYIMDIRAGRQVGWRWVGMQELVRFGWIVSGKENTIENILGILLR